MDNVKPIRDHNPILQKLDAEISALIMGTINDQRVTVSEVAGVLQAIQFKMFFLTITTH